MPYSSNSGKSVIKAVLKRLDKLVFRGALIRALDIGCGSGTYPKLVNPLLSSGVEWTGVEIWEPYIEQFGLRNLYKQLHVKPASEALDELHAYVKHDGPAKSFERLFDLIFVGDVLEHMPREEAVNVLNGCKRLLSMRGMLIVSVPIGEYPQEEYLGNPHEAHVDTWMTLQELEDALLMHEPLDWRLGKNAVKCMQDQEIGVGCYTSKEILKLLGPKVAAYMICKDEAAFIERCLASLEGVEEVIVCDTGSTDSTRELMQAFNSKHSDVWMHVTLKDIVVSPWRFDDARNAALGFVPADIDVCISIDADEVLEDGFVTAVKSMWWDTFWSAAPAYTRLYHSFITHWNWDAPTEPPNVSRHFHERVHARFGYRWVHPVHEKLVAAEPEVAAWRTDAVMKQLPDNAKNRSSYGPLLEQAVKEDPTDWKLWSFLSNERSTIGDIDGALAALDECLKLPESDKVFIAWRRAALFEWQGSVKAAQRELQKAVELNPQLRESHVMLAELCERHSHVLGSGGFSWRDALECKTPTQGYLRREELWTPEFEAKAKELSPITYTTQPGQA